MSPRAAVCVPCLGIREGPDRQSRLQWTNRIAVVGGEPLQGQANQTQTNGLVHRVTEG